MTKRTKETSRLVGVSRRTLQYYDEEGVVCVGRTKNNDRIYDQRTLDQIWKVMIYKEMGFSLKEIKELLEITAHMQKEYCEERLKTIRNERKELKKQAEFITAIIKEGIPAPPKEETNITYTEYLKSIRNGVAVKNVERISDVEKIKQLRYQLDEAYQEMQQKNFRYALYGAEMVMHEALQLLVSAGVHKNRKSVYFVIMQIKDLINFVEGRMDALR